MLNGLYVAVSGMMMQEKRVNVISNNLANINTKGYKADSTTFSNYLAEAQIPPEDIIRNSDYNKTINKTVKMASIYTDYSSGSIRQSGDKFDFALGNSKAFFAVETPAGIRFTRDGAFTLNDAGELVNQDGFKLLNNSQQPISVPNGDLSVTENGEIFVNGQEVSQLYTVEFDNNANLQKVGRNLFAVTDALPIESANPQVMHGYIEESNVNPVGEMVKMIEANRLFETYQKVIQTIDTLNDKSVNDLGRVA